MAAELEVIERRGPCARYPAAIITHVSAAAFMNNIMRAPGQSSVVYAHVQLLAHAFV